jgi:hypothetical protein
VALTKTIVVPKVPSKAPGRNKSLASTNQEVVPPKEDMLKAEEKRVTRRSLRNPTMIKIKRKV